MPVRSIGKKCRSYRSYTDAIRNKKSVGLSFKDPRGQKVLHALAVQSDVLVENYLPGTLAKYGLSYDHLSKVNPSLIYASITGYGQTGPYRDRAGYDVMVEVRNNDINTNAPILNLKNRLRWD